MIKIFAMALCFAMPASGLLAQSLEPPVEQVILTVTGAIEVTNGPDSASFDLPMLKNLGSEQVVTTTIWTEGSQTFTGVPLHVLLETVGVSEGSIRATAVNDYNVEIPMEDAVPGGALIAYENNGAPMSLRDKGPLWIIYPYDSKKEYQSEMIYSRSIWQLDRIEVLE